MRKILIIGLLCLNTSCWFSATIGNSFFGSDRRRLPSSPNRYATGIFLAPFAIALDVATFPIQFVVLLIAGDDVFDNFFLYVQNDQGEWQLVPAGSQSWRLVQKSLQTGQCTETDPLSFGHLKT